MPDMLVHEGLHAVEPFALAVRQVEVHWAFLAFLLKIVGGTVCPPSVLRKTLLPPKKAAAATAGWPGMPPRRAAH